MRPAVRSTREEVSRRQFLQGAAGLAAFAATLGSSRAEALQGPGIGLVLPIPTTLDIFGQDFHVQAPPFTGADSDPSMSTTSRGASESLSSAARSSGPTAKRVSRRRCRTLFNDMRFMQGRFEGRDGHVRAATFVFT